MRKLKECKSFAELYETIGEDNFSDIAKLLITILIASPLFWGIINYGMLIDTEYYYNAYTYNDKCMSLMFALSGIIFLWSFLYYFGKIRYEKLTLKQIYVNIKNNNPWLLPWILLLIWTLVPITFSELPFSALIGATFLANGYVTHILMFGIMGCAALISPEDRDDVYKSFVIIADMLAVILIAFEYEIPVIGQFAASGGMSVYTNQNHYAYYLTMACLVMMGGYYKSTIENSMKMRMFYIISFALNIYVLMIDDTMGAFLGIFFACIFAIIIWGASGKKLGVRQIVPLCIVIAITAISAAGYIEPSRTWEKQTTIGQGLKLLIMDLLKITKKTEGYRDAGTTRWGLWLDSIEWIKQRPIVGYGPDVMYNSQFEKFRDTPHNEYLECAFYLGIPGLALYLWGLFALLIDKCRKIKKLSLSMLISSGAAIAYLISAFFGVRKFNSVCFLFVFMGLIVQKDNLKKN